MRDLEENLHKYLLKVGQTVYIQGDRIHGRRDSKVRLVSYTEDQAVDFFTQCNTKVIDSDDFQKIKTDDKKLGKEVEISNGQIGVVVSSFHWGYTEKEKQELLESKKIDKLEDARSSLMSLVLVGDMLVLASERYLNPIDL